MGQAVVDQSVADSFVAAAAVDSFVAAAAVVVVVVAVAALGEGHPSDAADSFGRLPFADARNSLRPTKHDACRMHVRTCMYMCVST